MQILSAVRNTIRNTSFYSFAALVALAYSASSCNDSELPPAQKFAGTYSTTTWLYGYDDTTETTADITVYKTGDAEVYYTNAAGNTPYTASGNNLTQKTSLIRSITVDSMGTSLTGKYTLASSGSLSGKVLTITGTYSLAGRKTLSFKTVATKK